MRKHYRDLNEFQFLVCVLVEAGVEIYPRLINRDIVREILNDKLKAEQGSNKKTFQSILKLQLS